jgi:predicted dehydrogenase
MKQVLQSMRTGETIVAEVPVPAVRPNTALVRNAASLVSAGTERMLVEFGAKSLLGKARSRPDLVRQVVHKARREGILSAIEAAFNRLEQPIALGYSTAGVIAQLGEGLSGFHTGQRVACAGGNYAVHAEYALVPKNLLTPLPESVDFESAAFATLGAIALHGFRLAQVQIGERVAVIGLGLLGLLAVQIVQAAGCRALGIDLDPARVSLASHFGAAAVERPQALSAAQAFGRGRGVDAVLICADTRSADPIELAGEIARDRGRVIAVGAVELHIPRKVYYEKELALINSRSYGPGRYDPAYEAHGQDYPIGYVRWTEGRNLEAFIDLLANRSVDVLPLVSHRFPVHEAPRAYELITGKSGQPFIGVLLTYPQAQAAPEGVESSSAAPAFHPVPIQPGAAHRGITPKTVSLGVLGAGNFANAVLLPAVKAVSGIEPVAIASANGLSAQHAARRFGFRYAASQSEQVIADPQVNALAVLTRHHLHAGQVIAGLQAGKHVFCEKPLALTLEELARIAQVVSSENAPLLMVGFNRRFAPLAQRLQKFWQNRQEPLAISYRVNAGAIPPTHWVHDPIEGGGRIVGEACHFIDFMAFLAGAAPITVRGSLLPDGGVYREDNALLTFEFPDGSVGVLSYLANGDKSFSKERVEVFGAGKIAVLDDFRSLELVQDGKVEKLRRRLRQDKGHRAEWEAFTRAILAVGPPPIPYDQLFGVSRAAILSLQALRTGRAIRVYE